MSKVEVIKDILNVSIYGLQADIIEVEDESKIIKVAVSGDTKFFMQESENLIVNLSPIYCIGIQVYKCDNDILYLRR